MGDYVIVHWLCTAFITKQRSLVTVPADALINHAVVPVVVPLNNWHR